MRLLFVVDGRSPIALNWIRYFIRRQDEVHLASTFPCQPEPGLASFEVIQVAFSGVKGTPAQEAVGMTDKSSSRSKKSLSNRIPLGLRTGLRQWLGPLTIPSAARRLAEYAHRVQPDLVHAMRIPYEGMLAAQANLPYPLVISIWGNDFTLHARSNPWMAAATRQALGRCSALHTDCRRDLRLAGEWGFPAGRPSVVLPGNGGVQTEVFYPPDERAASPIVINPRGLRAYVRNDTFFQSVPQVLERLPQARFICPGMAGQPEAIRWVDKLNLGQQVELLPFQSQAEMAGLFRSAQVAVSPSTHDGTPNTLLEAMACGCFPIAGDIESIREWITPKENGSLIDPGDPTSLADAIVSAFSNTDLRERAARTNHDLILQRAEYFSTMSQASKFYSGLSGAK